LKLINQNVMPACRNSSRDAWICLCFNFRSRIIIFKVATNVHNIFNQRSPPYLVDLVTFSVSGPSVVKYGQQRPGPPLSFEQQLSSVDALFQSANSPPVLRLTDSHAAFRHALKTDLFETAFIWVNMWTFVMQSLCFYVYMTGVGTTIQ